MQYNDLHITAAVQNPSEITMWYPCPGRAAAAGVAAVHIGSDTETGITTFNITKCAHYTLKRTKKNTSIKNV